jgi:hypothetical protein
LSLLHGRLCIATNTLRVFALVVSLIAGIAHTATAADVTATRLDGSIIAGELRDWDDVQVVIVAPSGEQRIAADQLISLRFPSPPAPATPDPGAAGVAELADGTIIPINSLRVAGNIATLILDCPNGSKDNTLKLSTTQLAAVRFQRFDENLAKQWDEIRHLNLANDILVVLKRDGKSLDYVEGVMRDVADDKVEFKVDGESNRVDRAKVAGIFYYRADRPAATDPHLVLQGRAGLRASVAKVQFDHSQLIVTTVGGARFTLPIDGIDLADFSAGKVKFLSDIEPASQRWTPLVGFPAGVTLAAEYGQPRRDHSAFGGPLALLIKDKENEANSPQGSPHSFSKGLAIRSRTEIVYRLPAEFNRLIAIAGIEPATHASGNVRLSIFADDHPLLETEIAGDQPPQPIDVEITGAKRLKLVVDFGQNLDTGDWLNLCDAKIVK